MFSDPYIILLFPFFWASNWFYTYQLNCYQLFMFNTRTRSFTGLWYWLAQIIGAIIFGWFLDFKGLTRRNRAIAGWGVLFVIVNAVVSVPYRMAQPIALVGNGVFLFLSLPSGAVGSNPSSECRAPPIPMWPPRGSGAWTSMTGISPGTVS